MSLIFLLEHSLFDSNNIDIEIDNFCQFSVYQKKSLTFLFFVFILLLI